MRHLPTFLFLLIVFLHPFSIIAQDTYPVSKADAFSFARGAINEKDVDFYLCEEPILNISSEGQNLTISQNDTWTFFIDAEPLKGWEHDCYLVCINKRQRRDQFLIPKLIKLRLPPNGNFTPMEVKNRYGTKANQKPFVRKTALSNEVKSTAERTYAVILSGGINRLSNYERYWNDCSFIYQTLVNKYGVPKNNISVVMSDGTDSAEDMRAEAGEFKSSPLDLDNDGQQDIQYAATRNNIKKVLSNISQKIKQDDHLFFYVIDHGGTKDGINQSYICLWNSESLHDYELADWLRPFKEKSVYVSVLLGQCFSGGFIQELDEVGCVVAAASKGSESSWACGDIPYDEFVYQWTSAINEGNHLEHTISSDTDNNHRVTMEEAFKYAESNDRRSEEHPQYNSNPISVGEDLAFNNLPKAVDLYIKDSENDTGKEPNLITKEFWKSPDVWVRNKRDGIKEHENPYYSIDHPACCVYVRIHNRGKENFNGTGQWLHVYWAKASTGITIKACKGKETYKNHVTGEHLRAVPIPEIPAGGFKDVVVNWALPDDMVYSPEDNDTEKHHFCLIARIMNSFDDDSYDPQKTAFDVQGSNDIAQKNVSIVSKRDLSKGITVFVRNIYNNSHNYSLEVKAHTAKDAKLFTDANVKMTMAHPIYKAWERGGLRATNVTYNQTVNPYSVSFESPNSKLMNLCMNSTEFEKVTMNFMFYSPSLISSEKYTFDLIQRDDTGKIVGGETFIIESPEISREPVEIIPIEISNGSYELTTGLDEKDYSFKWINTNGENIGMDSKTIVTPTLANNEFSVTTLSMEGEMAKGTITLETQTGLKSVTPIVAENFVDVELHNPVQSEDAILKINSLTQDGADLLYQKIPTDTKQIRLNVSTLPSGMYVLTYFIGNQIIDNQKFNKK